MDGADLHPAGLSRAHYPIPQHSTPVIEITKVPAGASTPPRGLMSVLTVGLSLPGLPLASGTMPLWGQNNGLSFCGTTITARRLEHLLGAKMRGLVAGVGSGWVVGETGCAARAGAGPEEERTLWGEPEGWQGKGHRVGAGRGLLTPAHLPLPCSPFLPLCGIPVESSTCATREGPRCRSQPARPTQAPACGDGPEREASRERGESLCRQRHPNECHLQAELSWPTQPLCR